MGYLGADRTKVGWGYSSHSYLCQQYKHKQGYIPAKLLSRVDSWGERKDKKRVNWTKAIYCSLLWQHSWNSMYATINQKKHKECCLSMAARLYFVNRYDYTLFNLWSDHKQGIFRIEMYLKNHKLRMI